MRDGVGRRLFMAARRHGGEEKGRGVRLGASWGQEEEWRGRGQGAVPLELAQHGRGGSGLLEQRWVAHVARARRVRCEQGRRRRE
jgi:hypothetical protein